MAKCEPNHDEGFVLITDFGIFNMTCPKKRGVASGTQPMLLPES